MAISLEQVEFWLASTIGSDEGDLRSASQALENAQSISAFPFVLLTLSSGHVEEGRRLAAATYLKNLLKAQWHQSDFLSSSERGDFRNQLVNSLLRSDPLVLKALNEAFRLIVDNDFTRENIWPELVPAMKMALQKSNLLNGQNASEIRTFNALTAVQTMIRPFQYFMNPKLAKEPVPEQLELLSSELLVPLNQLFHVLVVEAKMSKECGASANDNSLLVICKCFHLAVRAHMPSSLQPYLGNWCQSFFTLLETIQLRQRVEGSEKLMRMKAWKRSLQIFCTMVSRHRKHVDKILPILSTALLDLVTRAAAMTEDLHPLQERVISSAFDTLSNILETGPGWRLISSHFSSLLEGAIFPALKIKEKDFIDWNEDPEEYSRKNLPSDLDYTSGWREDLYTPRRSALNLLGLISISKGPPTAVNTAKRKKAGNASKSKEARGTVGELLVVPFLSRFHLPPDGCTLTSEPVVNYYGVLLAYGGIQQFLKMQKPEHLLMLLRSHVLPLYSMSSPSPFLLANANWLLGEFASFLPEDLSTEIYDALVKALLAPDAGNISWRPVRNSAAAAISALLEEEFKPTEWLPVLKAAVTGARSEDNDDATTALQVLTKIADAAEEDIVPHIPTIILAIKGEVYKRIPDIPEPWPQVVESGFSAIVGLAQTWDSATAEVDEDDEAKIPNWKESCIAIGCAISELLQKAWLNYPEGVTETEVSPPSSCLNDISTLIVMMVKYTTEAEKVGSWKIEELLHTWSDLVADWSAWEEEEDIAVFEAIKEIISLQERFPLRHFGIASMPPVPALPVQPRSILEGIITFISSAIEVAYPAATWRACRIGHALLHVAGISFESDDITPLLAGRLFHAAGKRLVQLTSTKVPLAKPLVLLISMCYVCSPNSVILVLSEIIESREMISAWAEALAELAERLEDPMLSLESEIKLTVAAMLRLLNDICTNHIHDKGICDLKHTFLHALLTACVRLKELEDTEEETNDEEEETDNEDEEEEETDDEDDDSEDDEEEETEDQFLERYAQKAQELEKDALEEAEGGEVEDGQELEIGVLGLTEQMRTVYNFLESHGRELMNESPLPPEFLSGFLEHFPDSAQFFHR